MPTSDAERGGGKRPRQEYNLDAIARLLTGVARAGEVLVVVEKLQGLPPTRKDAATGEEKPLGGFLTNVARGESRGFGWMVAVLRALQLPCRSGRDVRRPGARAQAMDPDDTTGHDCERVDEEADEAPSPGVLRAVGELLAAVLTVAAVLAALLIAAVAVQWIFH